MKDHDDANLVGFFTRISPEARRAVKQEAAREDITMGEVVEQALKAWFARPKGAAARRKEKW